MIEKRNRNGGRDRDEEPDDDDQGSVEAEARNVQEAPQTQAAPCKPSRAWAAARASSSCC